MSVWGPECEWIHDLFDFEDIEVHAPAQGYPVVMSTWHADEPLNEAMTVFFSAFPDEGKPAGPARILLNVGERDWTGPMRTIVRQELARS